MEMNLCYIQIIPCARLFVRPRLRLRDAAGHARPKVQARIVMMKSSSHQGPHRCRARLWLHHLCQVPFLTMFPQEADRDQTMSLREADPDLDHRVEVRRPSRGQTLTILMARGPMTPRLHQTESRKDHVPMILQLRLQESRLDQGLMILPLPDVPHQLRLRAPAAPAEVNRLCLRHGPRLRLRRHRRLDRSAIDLSFPVAILQSSSQHDLALCRKCAMRATTNLCQPPGQRTITTLARKAKSTRTSTTKATPTSLPVSSVRPRSPP